MTAVLLATVLVSLCYQLGYIPQVELPKAFSFMPTFASYDELRDFLKTRSTAQYGYPYYSTNDGRFLFDGTQGFIAATKADSSQIEGSVHSSTNVQVTGVDEADIVKTDGEYIYLLTGNNVSIIKAYPPDEARLLCTITLNDISPAGIFVNGDRLAVLGSNYSTIKGPYLYSTTTYINEVATYLELYDISNKTDPTLIKTFTTSGEYLNSRMIDDYVYIVAGQPAYYRIEVFPGISVDKVNLPRIGPTDNAKEVSASEIYYSNVTDQYFTFTTIAAMNIKNVTQNTSSKTLMIGGTSTMYVSLTDIYVTYTTYDQIGYGYEQTAIYRIHVENGTITPEAQGKVPGQILNQFSMDEHGNDFRIATQTWNNSSPSSNVFILDMNITIVGQLRDIEVGETLDSARFIENRCYLSTSVVRRDPFFVIDIENVTAPHILGYLKIPGFTRYLHPYDSNHLIGVGRDGSNNVRVLLFDVSDVSAPKNISEYSFEADWSDTPVLNEHKAFLFDYSKDLLAFPVSLYYYGYNSSCIQPLMVFNITLEGGLVLKGSIIQRGTQTNGWGYSHYVQRSLYIERVLYTISQAEVQLNSLDDLTFLKEIEIG